MKFLKISLLFNFFLNFMKIEIIVIRESPSPLISSLRVQIEIKSARPS